MSEAKIYTKDETDILLGRARMPNEGPYLFNSRNVMTRTIVNTYSMGIWLTLQTVSGIYIPLFLPVNHETGMRWAAHIQRYFGALGQKIPIELADTRSLTNIKNIICDTLTSSVVTPTPFDYPICFQNTFLHALSSTGSVINDFIRTSSNLAISCISRTINADYIRPSDVLAFESIITKGLVIPLLGISKWEPTPNATAEETVLMLYVASKGGMTPFLPLAINLSEIQKIIIAGWSQLPELVPSLYS